MDNREIIELSEKLFKNLGDPCYPKIALPALVHTLANFIMTMSNTQPDPKSDRKKLVKNVCKILTSMVDQMVDKIED